MEKRAHIWEKIPAGGHASGPGQRVVEEPPTPSSQAHAFQPSLEDCHCGLRGMRGRTCPIWDTAWPSGAGVGMERCSCRRVEETFLILAAPFLRWYLESVEIGVGQAEKLWTQLGTDLQHELELGEEGNEA